MIIQSYLSSSTYWYGRNSGMSSEEMEWEQEQGR